MVWKLVRTPCSTWGSEKQIRCSLKPGGSSDKSLPEQFLPGKRQIREVTGSGYWREGSNLLFVCTIVVCYIFTVCTPTTNQGTVLVPVSCPFSHLPPSLPQPIILCLPGTTLSALQHLFPVPCCIHIWAYLIYSH